MNRTLTPRAQALLDQSTEARKAYILEDRFVEYDLARKHIQRMRDMLTAPTVESPHCLIVVGDPNNGKTSLIRHFVQRYAAPVDDPDEASARIPALHIVFRADVDETRLSHWILEALCAPYKDKDRPDKNFRMIRELVERLSVKVLVFDEFHHIQSTTGQRQRRALNAVKTLNTVLQLPIIATGVPQVGMLLNIDPQIERRFEALALPRWIHGLEFRRFLGGMEQDLPLKKVSKLADNELSKTIHDLSEGLLGEAVALVKRAAVAALDTSEQITLELIHALGFLPPSLRRDNLNKQLGFKVEPENKAK